MATFTAIITALGAVVIGGVLVFFVAWVIANALRISATQTLVDDPNWAILFTLIPIAILAIFGSIIISLFR